MKILVGVDPGASGGIAWTEPGEGVKAVAMPSTPAKLLELVRAIADQDSAQARTVEVYMEQVCGFGGGGGHPGSRMFSFGRGVGHLEMAFLSVGAVVKLIVPRVWQKEIVRQARAKRSDTEWKNLLKNLAQHRFPGLRVTLKTADALLILAYGRLVRSAE